MSAPLRLVAASPPAGPVLDKTAPGRRVVVRVAERLRDALTRWLEERMSGLAVQARKKTAALRAGDVVGICPTVAMHYTAPIPYQPCGLRVVGPDGVARDAHTQFRFRGQATRIMVVGRTDAADGSRFTVRFEAQAGERMRRVTGLVAGNDLEPVLRAILENQRHTITRWPLSAYDVAS